MSDYPKSHTLCSARNMKTIGKLEDELNSQPAIEFIGLRATMHFLHCNGGIKKTVKVVCKIIINREFLLKHTLIRIIQHFIRSNLYYIYVLQLNEISLFP